MPDAYEGCGIYHYTPLPSQKFIRLLELYPGHGNDDIDCALIHTELEQAPEYETISYTWGNPTNKSIVLCHGKIVKVTQNLKDALVRFRLKDRSRILWVDALCINQEDGPEKGFQVKLMNRIYGNATRVCVWLGCTTAQMQPAFELIAQIVNHPNPTSIHRAELPDSTSKCWSALQLFFSAAWFTRLWVIQEVYGHVCTVFCGEYEIPWSAVTQVARLVLRLDTLCDLSNANHFWIENAAAAINIDSAGDESLGFVVLDLFRTFGCSDQRDHVYALLSFPPFCTLRPLIEPDYSKTVTEVFEEATVRIFTSSQSLEFLSTLEHDCVIDEEWPSWIPRWDQYRTTQILHMYASGRAQSSLARIKYRPRILTVEGIRISKLSWCGMVVRSGVEIEDSASEAGFLKQPFQEWLLKYVPDIRHSTDHLLNCIAMTLTVGLDVDSNCPPLDLSQFRLDFLAYLVSILPSLDMLGIPQHLSRTLVEQGLAGNSRNFFLAAWRGCSNKRFFCTQNGEFGMGPRAAQAGDHIVLLYGSNAPCVLRPRGSYYQFVGECYLHQHMHGEAIEMATENLLTVEEFEMR